MLQTRKELLRGTLLAQVAVAVEEDEVPLFRVAGYTTDTRFRVSTNRFRRIEVLEVRVCYVSRFGMRKMPGCLSTVSLR